MAWYTCINSFVELCQFVQTGLTIPRKNGDAPVFSGPEVMSACHITILTYYNKANIIEAMEMEFGQNLCLPCFFPAKGILFAAYKIFIQENFFLANWIDFAIGFVIDSAINLAIEQDK